MANSYQQQIRKIVNNRAFFKILCVDPGYGGSKSMNFFLPSIGGSGIKQSM
jgi:microcystin-dependent protein